MAFLSTQGRATMSQASSMGSEEALEGREEGVGWGRGVGVGWGRTGTCVSGMEARCSPHPTR